MGQFFPLWDLLLCRSPIAIIISNDGQVVFRKMKSIQGKFFQCQINKHSSAIFMIDKSKMLTWKEGMGIGTLPFFLFDQRSINPIDPRVLSKLNRFIKINKLSKLTRNTKWLGDLYRNVLATEQEGDEEISNKTVDLVNKYSKDVEKDDIIQTLHDDGLIGLNEPLDADASSYLDDFKNLEPNYFFNLLAQYKSVQFNHRKLSSAKLQGGYTSIVILLIIMLIAGGGFYTLYLIDPNILNSLNIKLI